MPTIRRVMFILFCAGIIALGFGDAARAADTTIVAHIAPVRIITVDESGSIVRIQSNTAQNVAPTVVRQGKVNEPVALSPAVKREYTSLLPHLNLHRYGTIYQKSDPHTPGIISFFAQLKNRFSSLF